MQASTVTPVSLAKLDCLLLKKVLQKGLRCLKNSFVTREILDFHKIKFDPTLKSINLLYIFKNEQIVRGMTLSTISYTISPF